MTAAAGSGARALRYPKNENHSPMPSFDVRRLLPARQREGT
jgi:hypothetical protein